MTINHDSREITDVDEQRLTQIMSGEEASSSDATNRNTVDIQTDNPDCDDCESKQDSGPQSSEIMDSSLKREKKHFTRWQKLGAVIAGLAVVATSLFALKDSSEKEALPAVSATSTTVEIGEPLVVENTSTTVEAAVIEVEAKKVGDIVLSGRAPNPAAYLDIDYSSREATAESAPDPVYARSNDAQEICDIILSMASLNQLLGEDGYRKAVMHSGSSKNYSEVIAKLDTFRQEDSPFGSYFEVFNWGLVTDVEALDGGVYKIKFYNLIYEQTDLRKSISVYKDAYILVDYDEQDKAWKLVESQVEWGSGDKVYSSPNIIDRDVNPFVMPPEINESK